MNRALRSLSVVVVFATAAAAPSSARANGRFPASVSVATQPGDDQRIWMAVTFGLLFSADDGATWSWTCEANIGYTGIYDPVYAIASDGTIYATTPEGLRISRDLGCSFESAADLGDSWISDVQIASDGAIWATTSSSGSSNDVFVSRDGGKSFAATGLQTSTAWWKTVRVAPGDPNRVYVSGYQGDVALFRRSDDGGKSWQPIVATWMKTQPQLLLLGVSPNDPDLVYARIDSAPPEPLLRSKDGGMTWVAVAEFADDLLGFVIRDDGTTLLAGAQTGDPSTQGDLRISGDGGDGFTQAAEQPRVSCLAERDDGDLFVCATNWVPDMMGLGRSTDGGEHWTRVMRFSDLQGPLECDAASPHVEQCLPLWPMLRAQLSAGNDAGPRPDATVEPPIPPKEKCGCGISLGLAFVVVPFGQGRRRRRERRAAG